MADEAGGVFVIEELEGGLSASPAPPERFEWTASDVPGPKGGARAIPKGAWRIGGSQHTVRTDYPGAITPSEQVLGGRFEPFTLTGRWDDRYNFKGYAIGEKRRFEEMVRRGRGVRISFEDELYEGIITAFDFERKRTWDISYSFTFSNHGHPGAVRALPVSPPVASAPLAADRVLIFAQATLAEQENAPKAAIKGGSHRDVTSILEKLTTKLNALGDQIDARTSKLLQPLTTFKNLASQLRSIGGDAQAVLERLVAVRSDIELAVHTAETTLDFEGWRRATAFQCRLLMGQANKGAQEMEDRAEADPIRVYRPFKGESLYNVSRTFYGTPHSWRLIADRNGLKSLSLDGTEVLMIPERGAG